MVPLQALPSIHIAPSPPQISLPVARPLIPEEQPWPSGHWMSYVQLSAAGVLLTHKLSVQLSPERQDGVLFVAVAAQAHPSPTCPAFVTVKSVLLRVAPTCVQLSGAPIAFVADNVAVAAVKKNKANRSSF